MRLTLITFAAGAIMDSSFRVAFWGLLAGFGLSIALAATNPEEIRLALDTPPPPDFDVLESNTLLAESEPIAPQPPPAGVGGNVEPVPNLIATVPRPISPNIVPNLIESPAIPDNRLALDPDRPLLVPPFSSDVVARPVPPPPERPTVEIDTIENEGVPIEIEFDEGRPRIHVIVSPPRPREFVELPSPYELAQIDEGPETTEAGPTIRPPTNSETPLRQAPTLGEHLAGGSLMADSEVQQQLAELRSFFKQEMRSLQDEVQTLSAASSLEAQRVDVLIAQQELDRDRDQQQFGLILQDLDEIRSEIESLRPAVADATSPQSTIVVTPSACMSGRLDVEFHSTPAAEAFDCLGRLAGQNLLTSDLVQGDITAKLHDVMPWEAVLALAHAGNCRIVCDAGNFVVVPANAADDFQTE